MDRKLKVYLVRYVRYKPFEAGSDRCSKADHRHGDTDGKEF